MTNHAPATGLYRFTDRRTGRPAEKRYKRGQFVPRGAVLVRECEAPRRKKRDNQRGDSVPLRRLSGDDSHVGAIVGRELQNRCSQSGLDVRRGPVLVSAVRVGKDAYRLVPDPALDDRGPVTPLAPRKHWWAETTAHETAERLLLAELARMPSDFAAARANARVADGIALSKSDRDVLAARHVRAKERLIQDAIRRGAGGAVAVFRGL